MFITTRPVACNMAPDIAMGPAGCSGGERAMAPTVAAAKAGGHNRELERVLIWLGRDKVDVAVETAGVRMRPRRR